MYTGFIVLIVLMVLCAVLGAVYAYIYYTWINPRRHRIRKYVLPQTPPNVETPNPTPAKGVHVFLFRKA